MKHLLLLATIAASSVCLAACNGNRSNTYEDVPAYDTTLCCCPPADSVVCLAGGT